MAISRCTARCLRAGVRSSIGSPPAAWRPPELPQCQGLAFVGRRGFRSSVLSPVFRFRRARGGSDSALHGRCTGIAIATTGREASIVQDRCGGPAKKMRSAAQACAETHGARLCFGNGKWCVSFRGRRPTRFLVCPKQVGSVRLSQCVACRPRRSAGIPGSVPSRSERLDDPFATQQSDRSSYGLAQGLRAMRVLGG